MSGAERIDRLKRTSSLAEEGPEDLPFTLQDPLLHASIEALLLRTRETFPQSRANRVVLKQYFKRDQLDIRFTQQDRLRRPRSDRVVSMVSGAGLGRETLLEALC